MRPMRSDAGRESRVVRQIGEVRRAALPRRRVDRTPQRVPLRTLERGPARVRAPSAPSIVTRMPARSSTSTSTGRPESGDADPPAAGARTARRDERPGGRRASSSAMPRAVGAALPRAVQRHRREHAAQPIASTSAARQQTARGHGIRRRSLTATAALRARRIRAATSARRRARSRTSGHATGPRAQPDVARGRAGRATRAPRRPPRAARARPTRVRRRRTIATGPSERPVGGKARAERQLGTPPRGISQTASGQRSARSCRRSDQRPQLVRQRACA